MALERVNYYTGQRLDADDFRTEQHYQAQIRRLLNHGLFTPGVVEGLQVERIIEGGQPAPRAVRVSPGSALDALGRLVVLDTATDVAVPNQPPLGGTNYYYLVLRYAEEPVPGRADDCAPPGTAPANRIREQQVLDWSEVIPFPRPSDPEDSIQQGVVIALVELDKDCKIAAIDASARRLSFPRNVSRVQAVAFEGEKDIAKDDPKQLYFHIRGGSPSAVVLYLRGGQFSRTAYTESAAHTHTLSGTAVGSTNVATQNHQHALNQHSHTLTEQVPDPMRGTHQHRLWMQALTNNNHPERAIQTWRGWTIDYTMHGYSEDADDNPANFEDYVEAAGGHTHALSLSTEGDAATGGLQPAPAAVGHSHSFAATVDPVGSTGHTLRGGAAYTFPTDVRVALDGKDITLRLLRALPASWQALGTLGGDQNHPFNNEGTGPLDLVQLGLALGPGEHVLEFSAPDPPAGLPPVGGKIIYNLYVE
jgi:hypothetical protein